MILIKNNQRKIKIDAKKIHSRVEKMLEVAGYADFDLSVIFTTNKTIQRLNKVFRGKDSATDILSFPFNPDLKHGQPAKIHSEQEKILGDIVISLQYAQKDAVSKWARGLEHHLTALIAHGIAHLIGHDHHTDQEFKKMLKVEKNLLGSINLKY